MLIQLLIPRNRIHQVVCHVSFRRNPITHSHLNVFVLQTTSRLFLQGEQEQSGTKFQRTFIFMKENCTELVFQYIITMVISSETTCCQQKERKEGFQKRKSKVHYNAIFTLLDTTTDRVNEWYILDFFVFSFLLFLFPSMSLRIFPRETSMYVYCMTGRKSRVIEIFEWNFIMSGWFLTHMIYIVVGKSSVRFI